MTSCIHTWRMAEEEATRRNASLVKQYGSMKSYALWRPYDIVLEWAEKEEGEESSNANTENTQNTETIMEININ